jgi:glutamate carboxypeptidase
MNQVRNIALFTCTALALTVAARAQVRDAAVFAAAQAAQPAVIETLQQLVKIESGSGNLDGLSKVADFAEARLKALGAQTERLKSTSGERPILKGVLTGSGKLKVMLLAHMDTVYADGILATQSYTSTAIDSTVQASPMTKAAWQ